MTIQELTTIAEICGKTSEYVLDRLGADKSDVIEKINNYDIVKDLTNRIKNHLLEKPDDEYFEDSFEICNIIFYKIGYRIKGDFAYFNDNKDMKIQNYNKDVLLKLAEALDNNELLPF